MRREQIHVGSSYVVSSSWGRGRAVVTGPQQPVTWGSPTWPVRFPDANHGYSSEAKIPSRDFLRPWTEEDEAEFNEGRRTQAEVAALKRALLTAGFEAKVSKHAVLRVSLEGDDAERAVAVLIDSAVQRALEGK